MITPSGLVPPRRQGIQKSARRIVVKVGSTLVTNEGRGVDAQAIGQWCAQMAGLRNEGIEWVMVSSGAVAEGMKRLGLSKRPDRLDELQAAAAVGQMGLAQIYERELDRHGVLSAQILLTHADLADRERYLNARSTLTTLLGLGVIPVINENDSVVNDEIRFGDNDTLAALVAQLLEADLLIILTDQRGLYAADPRKDPDARFIEEAAAGDPSLEAMAGGSGSALGRGGMLTKVLAAGRAALAGTSTVIAFGREPQVLERLCRGESIGTALCATTAKLAARKRWMMGQLQLKGRLTIDEGAAAKLRDEGKSLLPIGLLAVHGDFHRGDLVSVESTDGRTIGRGLVNYGSAEARRLLRCPSSEIVDRLGFCSETELIHRDQWVPERPLSESADGHPAKGRGDSVSAASPG